MINLFDDLPRQSDKEVLTELLWRKGVRIERIVSTGQSTPVDKPYNIIRNTTSGSCLSSARPVCGSREKPNASLGRVTMS